jgi:hypothetical protein
MSPISGGVGCDIAAASIGLSFGGVRHEDAGMTASVGREAEREPQ